MTTCTIENAPALPRTNAADWFFLAAPGLIWGASFLFIAEALHAVGPFGVTFLRIVTGFATLSLFPAARKPIARGDWPAIVMVSVLWMAFPLTMFPLAEQRVSSALTGMLNGVTPIATAAVGALIARRLPPRRIVLGVLIGFGGAVLMAASGSQRANSEWSGILMILAAIASYGLVFNIMGPLQQRNGSLPVILRALFVAMLFTAPLGLRDVAHAHWTRPSAASLLALGALGTGVAFAIFATAMARIGPTRASATTFLTPVVALALGVIVRGESVTALSVAGAATCLAGAAVIRMGVRRR